MPGLSNVLETALLEWLFKQTAFPSPPSTLWVSLHSADPADTGANEISGGSYARVQLNPDPNNATNTNWNAVGTSGTAKRMSNKLDIPFATASADWNSGSPIPYWGTWSLVSGGTFYVSGAITGGVVVLNTNTLRFTGGSPTGSLLFDCD